MSERLTPRVRVHDIDHGRHDMFGLHGAFGESTGGNTDEAELRARGDTTSLSPPCEQGSKAVGARSSELRRYVSFKRSLLRAEAQQADRARPTSEAPAAKHSRDVRARDVNLIPEGAKNKSTGGSMAREESIADTTHVKVSSAAASDATCRVWVEGFVVDDAVSVHGEGKRA